MSQPKPKRGDEQRDPGGRVWIITSVTWDGPRPQLARVLKGSAAERIEFPERARPPLPT